MSSDQGTGAGVPGGGSISVEYYAGVLDRHYLADYLPAGGAAVKLAVAGEGGAAERLVGTLADLAARRRCLHVEVSAETTRIHLVDQLYAQVARRLDWDGLAVDVVRAAYAAVSFPAAGDLSVTAVAAEHDVDARELYRSVRRHLENQLLGEPSLAPEMRRAILRLAQFQVAAGDVDDGEHAAVLEWLRCDLRRVGAVRGALIFGRIGRHNARTMLASLARLILVTGRGGLILTLDCRRLEESRRPPVALRSGVYYSRAAVLDAYETLRQLVDGVDELRGVLVVAVLSPTLMTDESRGLPAYAALQLRVADEVRDHRRANPFASLVRLDVRLEAVS